LGVQRRNIWKSEYLDLNAADSTPFVILSDDLRTRVARSGKKI